MAIWSFLFGGNKETPKRTFSDVSLDELNRECIGCQQEINKVERQQEALLKNENQLKNEYANATTEFQRKSIARKIQDGNGAETGGSLAHSFKSEHSYRK